VNSLPSRIQSYQKGQDNVAIISLDVLVAEVELNNDFARGIDWSVFYSNSSNENNRETGTFGFPEGLAENLKPFSIGFGLIDSHWDISAVLSFLETQGRTEILQKPTLTVLNGNRAFLKAGKEIPYVDEIKITPTQVGTALTFLQEVTFATVLDGIEIEILPRLREDLITLSLRGVITSFIEFMEIETGGATGAATIEKPVTTSRDVQSITALKAGEILKIGGIIVSRDQRAKKGFPGSEASRLTDLLFSNKVDSSARSEIVILVKPRVIRFKESMAPFWVQINKDGGKKMLKFKALKNNKGFTLVEMLVILLIIGVIVAVLVGIMGNPVTQCDNRRNSVARQG
jgi:general secretion pathway protein D